MVAPGFRSRIATGLLVAAVVLPVPIGATSAAAADRRATPVDRPPLLARPGDQPDDLPGGTDGFGLDGFDDFAIGPPPVEGPGAGGGRVRAGHRGHPGAPALPDRYPGLPDALPGVPHRPSHHHHFGGLRGHGRWHHHPHHSFGPGFPVPGPPYSISGPDGGGADFPRPGRHRHPDAAGSSDTDRAHARPGRRAPKKHRKPTASESHAAAATPSRPAPSHRYDVADRFSRRTYEALPPLPTPAPEGGGSARESTEDDAAATAAPYAMETPVAPVERVLPMGAGLALTGLGLAFFALRLRRG
ncbi:hypothetical protein ACFWJW_23400 [Streptomyces sp. NPDC127097]|uniref:hypothetical protein n=1 Tax=Streptomyces sp. NPDC127097 TaxID=3347136 RepID=UPI0036527E53